MRIIQKRKFYFAISGLLVAASVVSVAVFGLNLGIDFTGGSLLELEVRQDIHTQVSRIEDILTQGETPILPSVLVQPTGERGYILRFKEVTQQEHQKILHALRQALAPESANASADDSLLSGVEAVDDQGNPATLEVEQVDIETNEPRAPVDETVVEEMRFESIGPVIGQELRDKSVKGLIAVLSAIVLYIAWAFRKVSEPVASWKYGVTAIIALIHDVAIPTGVFVVLGKVLGVEMDILFVTALLTILGFSVNDTIVVFDRTRENLARYHGREEFEEIVNKSVNETIRRSINTSLTTFAVLFAIFLFGGESIKYFVLALMIGVVVGTYSSIFLASPLLVQWEHWSRRNNRE